MSSILKALKKLEDDKAVRRPDDLKIDAEILRSDNAPGFSSTTVAIVALLLLAGGSGGTYLFMKRGAAPLPPSAIQAAAPGRNTAKFPPSSEIKTEQLPAAVVIVPAPPQTKVTSRAAPLSTPRRSVSPDQAPKPGTTAKDSQLNSPAPVSPPHPALRVNGIAFQNNPADSMAIINGTPVSTGSVIEGVTVEEIRKDRVLFQHGGDRFGIQLGQSNR